MRKPPLAQTLAIKSINYRGLLRPFNLKEVRKKSEEIKRLSEGKA